MSFNINRTSQALNEVMQIALKFTCHLGVTAFY